MINIDSMIKKIQQEGFKEEDATAKVSVTEIQETYWKLPANHKTIFFTSFCYNLLSNYIHYGHNPLFSSVLDAQLSKNSFSVH